jgi:hypothetical protein
MNALEAQGVPATRILAEGLFGAAKNSDDLQQKIRLTNLVLQRGIITGQKATDIINKYADAQKGAAKAQSLTPGSNIQQAIDLAKVLGGQLLNTIINAGPKVNVGSNNPKPGNFDVAQQGLGLGTKDLSSIKTRFSLLQKSYRDTWYYIKNNVFNVNLRYIQAFSLQIWKQMQTDVSSVWTDIINWFTTNIGGLATSFASWFTDIPTNIAADWAQIQLDVTNAWNSITSWIATNVGVLPGRIETWFADIPANLYAMWGQVSSTTSQWWTNILAWLNTYIFPIPGNIINWFNQLPTWFYNLWNSVSTQVTNWWNSIIGWLANNVAVIPGNIITWFTNLPNLIAITWQNIQTDVQAFWQNIINWLDANVFPIPGNIISWFLSLPSKIAAIFAGIKIPGINIGLNGISIGGNNPGMASGGMSTGGMYDVGEFGKETVYLPAGAGVIPLGMQNGGASSGDINLHFHGDTYGFNDFESQVIQALQNATRRGRHNMDNTGMV